MRKKILVILVLSAITLCCPTTYSGNYAVTSNGRKVILHKNKTWEYKKNEINTDLNSTYIDNNVKIYVKKVKIENYVSLNSMEEHLQSGQNLLKNEAKKSKRISCIIKIKNLKNHHILHPETHDVYGYREGSDSGGVYVSSISLYDNFNNDMKIEKLSPVYTGLKERGLRPGETKKFTIKTKNYPVDAATFLKLTIDKDVFDNNKFAKIKIPLNRLKKN